MELCISAPVRRTFRTVQAAGLFDIPLSDRSVSRITVDVPEDFPGTDWRIGVITGPSGSGKSTFARQVFGEACISDGQMRWPAEESVLDAFPENMSTADVVKYLTQVGFSSPPSWVRPFHALSTGERFRCTLARALAEGNERKSVVVYDEYTSVVDRTVAKVCSAALAKSIRNNHMQCQFVAVTCHYDIVEWLEPDWCVDMATGVFTRRSLRRPPIRIEIYECSKTAWSMFKRYHYLDGSLPSAVVCYAAMHDNTPVGLCVVSGTGSDRVRRISRIVIVPDYQGIGIGGHFMDWVARHYLEKGCRIRITATHPAVIRHCLRTWKFVGRRFTTPHNWRRKVTAMTRAVCTFEYMG